jgi:CRP/FNR family transcriptional regulator
MLYSFKGARNLLSLFDEEQQQQLLDSAKTIHLVANQMLFTKDDPANHFYLVKKGQVKLFRVTPSGDEKIFHLFFPGGWIAETAMFLPSPCYPMNAQADIASEVLVVKRELLLSIVENSPKLARQLLGFMSTKISELVNNVDKLTFISASQRLVLHLGHLYQVQNFGHNRVRLQVPKRVLASQLNITPETFSRILRKFKSQGLIEENGDSIILLDKETLCSEVGLTAEIFQL